MKSRLIIGIGVILILVGAFGGVLVYQNAESGSNFLSVAGQGLVTKDLSAEVAQSKGQNVPVIVAYDPVSKGLSVNALSVRGQEIKSLAVRNLSVYGFSLSQEEVIPAFGMVVGEAPAENVDEISESPGVRAVVRNRFISVGGDGTFKSLSQSYASAEDFVQYHEANELPPADNIVISIVDSKAPKEPWVVNAVSVRGDKPYAGFWHGEIVAKTCHEVAPEAKITIIKTLDEFGTARLSTILKGLQTAATMKPRASVINLSLGTPAGKLYQPLDVACDTIEREWNVEIVTASGNTGGKNMTSPATASSTLSVGAITPEGEVTDYSSSEYDVLAIGNVIINGREARGTSFSSPILAGVTARALALSGVEKGEIDMKSTLIQSTRLFQEQGNELPIVKGSVIKKTKLVKESTPMEKTAPYIAVSLVGLFAVFWGVEEEKF